MGDLYVALMHGQVVNKKGEEISSALTHFDLHDIARSCRTYGVSRYYIVTPLETMRYLAQRMISYWNAGLGAEAIPNRKDAIEIVEVVTYLEEVEERIEEREGKRPKKFSTSARADRGVVSYEEVSDLIRSTDHPVLIIFGTAYGLTTQVRESCDGELPAIRSGRWNHLSVRSAVAVVLDRLVGEDDTIGNGDLL